MEVTCVLRVFDDSAGSVKVACTLSPLCDLIPKGSGLTSLPLEVWVSWVSRWMTPQALSLLERATPHVAGLLAKVC